MGLPGPESERRLQREYLVLQYSQSLFSEAVGEGPDRWGLQECGDLDSLVKRPLDFGQELRG
jgi:hypothetical protein